MKKLIAILVVIALFIPTTIAFAAPVDPAVKEKLAEFKSSMEDKRDQIKSNRENNQQLRESIKGKKEQIKAAIEVLKQDKEANKDKLAQLKTQAQAVKETRQELKALHGTVKAEFAKFKENKKSGNFEGASENLDNIIRIQLQRFQLLTELNIQVDEILSQLR
jgi:uncharacterized protein (DUF3084 family)